MARYTYQNQAFDFKGREIGPVSVFNKAAEARSDASVRVALQIQIWQIRIYRCLEHTYDFKPYMMVYVNIVTNKVRCSKRKFFK